MDVCREAMVQTKRMEVAEVLFRYYLRTGDKSQEGEKVRNDCFILFAKAGRDEILRMFWDSTPPLPMPPQHIVEAALLIASKHCHASVVGLLLTDPRLDIERLSASYLADMQLTDMKPDPRAWKIIELFVKNKRTPSHVLDELLATSVEYPEIEC